MTDSVSGRTGSGARRSGGGCATALGVALILAGGLFLWTNLADAPLALLVLDLLPLAAVWWPLLLVLWGVWKLSVRLRTGRARFGCWEGALLVLILLVGTGLTLGQRAIESQGLEMRMTEVRRLVEEQSGRVAPHSFVTDHAVGLLPGDDFEVVLSLPTGNIRLEAAPFGQRPPANETPGEPADPQPAPGDESPEGAGNEPPVEVPEEAPAEEEAFEARLRLVTRVWAADAAEAAARAAAVRLRSGPPDLENAQFPIWVEDSGDTEVALELVGTLPAGAAVAARTERGSVRVEGPFQRVRIHSDGGPVEVRGTAGPASVTARNGAVWASAIGGALEIRARRAAVEVDSVTGTAAVEAEGAPVWISGAGAAVIVRGQDAAITVEDSAGPVEVETTISPVRLERIAGSALLRSDFGGVVAASVGGELRIRTESADVEVRGARGEVDVRAAGGALFFEEVTGPLAVTSGRGEVFASRLRGPARFTADAGALAVREFAGSLSVTAGDAEVDVWGVGVGDPGFGGDVALTTDRGNIRLTLAEGASFALSARTEAGAVESDFPLERQESEGVSVWESAGEAEAAAGARRVTLSTGRGDITVRAASDEGETR